MKNNKLKKIVAGSVLLIPAVLLFAGESKEANASMLRGAVSKLTNGLRSSVSSLTSVSSSTSSTSAATKAKLKVNQFNLSGALGGKNSSYTQKATKEHAYSKPISSSSSTSTSNTTSTGGGPKEPIYQNWMSTSQASGSTSTTSTGSSSGLKPKNKVTNVPTGSNDPIYETIKDTSTGSSGLNLGSKFNIDKLALDPDGGPGDSDITASLSNRPGTTNPDKLTLNQLKHALTQIGMGNLSPVIPDDID